MLHVLALVVLAQVPPGGGLRPGDQRLPPPPASETSKLYFLAGDIAKAVEWATRGMKKESKACKPLLKALAEYAALANHRDEFTIAQAREFIEWDRQISPGTPGKITVPIIDRYITSPLSVAAEMEKQGRVAEAVAIATRVLEVDPKNVEATRLAKRAPDAGVTPHSPDAGRAH